MWSLHYSEDETPKSLYARVKRAEAPEARERSPTSWNYFRIVFFGTTNSLFVFLNLDYMCKVVVKVQRCTWCGVKTLTPKKQTIEFLFIIFSLLLRVQMIISFEHIN